MNFDGKRFFNHVGSGDTLTAVAKAHFSCVCWNIVSNTSVKQKVRTAVKTMIYVPDLSPTQNPCLITLRDFISNSPECFLSPELQHLDQVQDHFRVVLPIVVCGPSAKELKIAIDMVGVLVKNNFFRLQFSTFFAQLVAFPSILVTFSPFSMFRV